MYIIPILLSLKKTFSNDKKIWIIIGILYSVLIGFRHEVGGDWFNYLYHFNDMQYYTISSILERSDPGYYLINYILYSLGLEVYLMNFVAGIIFISGLIAFARRQFNPWLAFAVAIPYLTVVVAMGYTRQSIAIGFIFFALNALSDKKIFKFVFFVFLATLFHKSAVLVIGIGLFSNGINIYLRILAVGFVGYGVYDSFLASHAEKLWVNYVEAQMESSGAKIRVAMNLVPAILLFIFRKEWQKNYESDYNYWKIIAIISLLLIVLVNFATTAVDRVALYMIPLQIVVFGRLQVLASNYFSNNTIFFSIVIYYSAVLSVWLFLGSHAKYWLPYQNILIHDLW
jgi:hypothetical protein